jgi:hypothetical protein
MHGHAPRPRITGTGRRNVTPVSFRSRSPRTNRALRDVADFSQRGRSAPRLARGGRSRPRPCRSTGQVGSPLAWIGQFLRQRLCDARTLVRKAVKPLDAWVVQIAGDGPVRVRVGASTKDMEPPSCPRYGHLRPPSACSLTNPSAFADPPDSGPVYASAKTIGLVPVERSLSVLRPSERLETGHRNRHAAWCARVV